MGWIAEKDGMSFFTGKGVEVFTSKANWGILSKNLVTFRQWDGVKDEKF